MSDFTVLLLMPDWYRNQCASESDWVRTVRLKASGPAEAARGAAIYLGQCIEACPDVFAPVAIFAGDHESLL